MTAVSPTPISLFMLSPYAPPSSVGGAFFHMEARMRHVIFGALVLLYVLTLGQNWAHYSAAVMVAAWVRHDGRLTTLIH